MSPARTTTIEAICERAIDLGGQDLTNERPSSGAAGELVALAGTDRAALVGARDRLAARLRGNQADFVATAALTLLNRAVADFGWDDRLDWKRRWTQHRKP